MPVVDFISSDGEMFHVEGELVTRFKAVKTLMEDLGIEAGDGEEDIIPIEVNSEVFKVILEWTKHHKDDPEPEPDQKKGPISKWNKEFLDKAEPGLLFEIIVATKVLDIGWLQTLACGRVQSMITGKNPKQLQKAFGLENDFSREEEEKIRQENAWCEEK